MSSDLGGNPEVDKGGNPKVDKGWSYSRNPIPEMVGQCGDGRKGEQKMENVCWLHTFK